MTPYNPLQDGGTEHLSVLADEEQYAILRYFRDVSEPVVAVDDLADEISARDHATDVTAIRLHHVILPRLDDAGVVEYDPRSNTARYRGDRELERLLDTLADS